MKFSCCVQPYVSISVCSARTDTQHSRGLSLVDLLRQLGPTIIAKQPKRHKEIVRDSLISSRLRSYQIWRMTPG